MRVHYRGIPLVVVRHFEPVILSWIANVYAMGMTYNLAVPRQNGMVAADGDDQEFGTEMVRAGLVASIRRPSGDILVQPIDNASEELLRSFGRELTEMMTTAHLVPLAPLFCQSDLDSLRTASPEPLTLVDRTSMEIV